MENEINNKFDERLEKMRKELPAMRKGVNCCELTLTNILDVLGVDSYLFHNLAMPLAGGFGGYKAKDGWQGACGAVTGACAAIGVIMGGDKKMDDGQMVIAYLKASKYCSDFEGEFQSVLCSRLCGYDFSTPEGFIQYQKNRVWEKTCYKFVIWAVNHVRKLTKKDLRNNW